jgi:acetyl esterase/lipase
MRAVPSAIPAILSLSLSLPACLSNPGDKSNVSHASLRATTPAGAIELLWPRGAPLAAGEEERDRPSLAVYLAPAEKAGGAAVIVCPGGGYDHLATEPEGREPALWLNKLGVHAFVLTYRIAQRYHHPAPMLDAQRAVRIVRARAAEWRIDPARIGIWGFSAGGHLASTVLTHFDDGKGDAEDPIDRVSSRPDFGILAYPVIVFDKPYAHKGSRRNLLGDRAADPELLFDLSTDNRVTERTPPTFLVHAEDDTKVPPENSGDFFRALNRAKVPAELHLLPRGGHGFGLGNDRYPELRSWPDLLSKWLTARGVLAER